MAKYYSDDPEYTQISTVDVNTRSLIEKVLENYCTDLSNSHWHGSSYGVREDNFEDVAEDIMTKLSLWEEDK